MDAEARKKSLKRRYGGRAAKAPAGPGGPGGHGGPGGRRRMSMAKGKPKEMKKTIGRLMGYLSADRSSIPTSRVWTGAEETRQGWQGPSL